MANKITWAEDNSPAGIFEVEGELISVDGKIATVKDSDGDIMEIQASQIICEDETIEDMLYGETHRVVCWPDIQEYMMAPEFDANAILINSEAGYAKYGDSSYMVSNTWTPSVTIYS